MAISAPSSFTNRQVAKLQARAEGITVSEQGLIFKDGQQVGRVEAGSKLHGDFLALFPNIDLLGLEYRQGQEGASEEELRQIASFPIEVMLMPTPGHEHAVGVQQERAFFSETDVARDVARLYEDFPLVARNLLSRRGIELEGPERPDLSDLTLVPAAAELGSEHEIDPEL